MASIDLPIAENIMESGSHQNQQTSYILALDLGTTGNRAFVFDSNGQIVGQAYKELTQYYPQPGWLD